MKYTKKQLTKAFEQWQINVRLTPSEFMSDEDCMNLDVSEYAKLQVEELIKYIK